MTDSDLSEILDALSADEADEQTYKLLAATHQEDVKAIAFVPLAELIAE